MLAICPACDRPITVDDSGWNFCRQCGKRVWIPDPRDPDQPPLPDLEAFTVSLQEPESTSVIWETPNQGNVLTRFGQTIFEILFRTRDFFSRIPTGFFEVRVHYYGVAVVSIGLFFYFQLMSISLGALQAAQQSGLPETQTPMIQEMLREFARMQLQPSFLQLSAILAPIFAVLVLWITRGLVSLACSLQAREERPSRPRITRVVCYSYTPWLFLAIPFLGVLWYIAIQYRALRFGLGFSVRMSILTVALNLLMLSFALQVWFSVPTLLFSH